MTKTYPKETIRDLTMLLIYLTSFKDNSPYAADLLTAWKGYDFGVLNELDEGDYIRQGGKKSKSLLITDRGVKLAEELFEKYGIELIV